MNKYQPHDPRNYVPQTMPGASKSLPQTNQTDPEDNTKLVDGLNNSNNQTDPLDILLTGIFPKAPPLQVEHAKAALQAEIDRQVREARIRNVDAMLYLKMDKATRDFLEKRLKTLKTERPTPGAIEGGQDD